MKFNEIKVRMMIRYPVLVTFAMLILAAAMTPVRTKSIQQGALGSFDVQSLVKSSDLNGAAMHQRLPEYTYIQTRITREKDRNGRVSERVRQYEAYPINVSGRHRHILSMISRDGVAIPPDQIEKNRRLAVDEMEKAELTEVPSPDAHDAAAPVQYVTAGIGIGASGEGVWLSASQFLHHCRFSDPFRISFGGRDTIRLVFHSCRVYPASRRENYLEGLSGIAWIDEADKVVVRIEAWPASDAMNSHEILSSRPADPTIVYDQQLIHGGIWAPRLIRLNGIGRSAIFNGVDKDMAFKFTDYKHFSTEIRDPDIADPRKKPIPHQ